MTVYIGGDVSKGYADFCVVGSEGTLLHECRLDDTAAGHKELEALLKNLVDPDEEETVLIAGMEATGGMERNWLKRFNELGERLNVRVYQINPFVLRRFTDQKLHANKTDPLSARAVADYLRVGMRNDEQPTAHDGLAEGLQTLERQTLNKIDRVAQLKTQLKNLLQIAHPELVQYARSTELPQWLLTLIASYPTPERVVEAGVEEVAQINYVSTSRASSIVAAARESVASLEGPDTALALQMLAEDIQRLNDQIDRLKERLWKRVSSEEGPEILQSIGGLAKWSATVLYCEIGDIRRFPSATQLVAFAGLDSQREYSGDSELERPISKRGNARIRRILFNCVQVALQDGINPPIRDFYDRLRDRGKHHMVAMIACMRKLLAIIYGCWSKGQKFDPGYESRLKARKSAHGPERQDGPGRSETKTRDLKAPVSAKEARRRKEATQPQESVSSQARGQKAASSRDKYEPPHG